MASLDGTAVAVTPASASGLPAHPFHSQGFAPSADRQARGASVVPDPPAGLSNPARAVSTPSDPRDALARLDDRPESQSAQIQTVNYEGPAAGLAAGLPPSLSEAISQLERRVENKPPSDTSSAQREIELRLLYLAAGRREDALRPIAGLTAAEQEYWSSQFFALSTWLDVGRNPAADRRAGETVTHLDRARGKLAEIGSLQVRNPHFCTSVEGYGTFTRFKEDVFKPGQDVVLYAEIDNFCSEATDQGYRTSLASRYRILDSRGQQVAEKDHEAINEVCQNRRRDYYISIRLRMPARIYDGRHTLQLTIEDVLGKKVGQASIEFTIKE
jgi:hypothetical protein